MSVQEFQRQQRHQKDIGKIFVGEKRSYRDIHAMRSLVIGE